MAESKNSTTTRVLKTQQAVMNWTLLLADLLLLAVLAAGLVVWHVQAYAGGWQAMTQARFTDCYLSAERPFRLLLHLAAQGLEPKILDITDQFYLLAGVYLAYLVLRWLVQSISAAVGRSRVRQHMMQVSLLAQEAQRLGYEEAQRNFRAPRVDVLEQAIDHISPTETERLHTGDPDLQGLEKAVNDLLDRMQTAYSQQSRFVSDASHELRTPIAVLKGYADLLERWGKDDPQVRDEAIAAIQKEAERMSRLVEQLLFLARGDSGRTQLQPESLDLAELAREVWEESEMIDPRHQWVLEAPQPVPCTADRDMLKQALRILCDNGAKYTPEGKKITIMAYENEKNRPCLAVRDEGMGISREDAAHVFDRFYRSDPARTRQSGGAGLGLSIAEWIAARHNGHMELYSWEGIGSRFTIVL